MSYYDPEVYNYDALHQEDKGIINYARHLRKDVLDALRNDAEIVANDDESDTLEKIKVEIILQTIDELEKRFEIKEMESIVAIIDDYE